MKNLFLVALMAAFTSTAMAKIAIYDEQDALNKVLNDKKTMTEIKSKLPGKLMSTHVTSSVPTVNNQTKFIVRLIYSAKTPIGPRSCYVDVNLSTKIKVIPGSRIATNSLIIEKVGTALCQK